VLGPWQAILGCSVTVLIGLLTWYALPLAIRIARPDVAPEPRRSPRSHATEA
jgi:hypothetical protein